MGQFTNHINQYTLRKKTNTIRVSSEEDVSKINPSYYNNKMKCTIQNNKRKITITIPGKDNNKNTISVVWNNLMKEIKIKRNNKNQKQNVCVCVNLFYERILWSTG